MLDIPVCPDCGRLAEWVDDEIYCEECYAEFFRRTIERLGAVELAKLSAAMKQDMLLGIGLECTPDGRNLV
jgi:hypothetical protein